MTIDRLAVIGAGFMGSGIAEAAAAAGVAVTLYEPDRRRWSAHASAWATRSRARSRVASAPPRMPRR